MMLNDALAIVATLLVALTAFLAVYAATSRLGEALSPPDEETRARATQELRRPYFWAVLVRRAHVVVPNRVGKNLSRKIVMAGGLEGMTPAEVFLIAFVSTMLALATGIMLVTLTAWSSWWAVPVTVTGAALPFAWLRDQVKKRHLDILADMPFHLDLLTLSVEAGLDFGAAVGRMVEKGKPGPLREEFSSFLGEIRMGKTRAEAMESMSKRVGLPALSNFLGALMQADKLGSGLGRTLRLQSEQLRVERSQRAEKAAGEAPVKMLIPLLFIFVTTWVILAAPLVFEWIYKGSP